MARATRVGVLLAGLLVAAGALYAATLPRRAAQELTAAIASADEGALRAAVDFDALRENVKDQLLQSFHAAEPDPRLGMVASRYIGALVDGLVTPETLLDLAQRSVALEGSRARWTGWSSAVVEIAGAEPFVGRWHLERRGLSFVLVGIELPSSMTAELKERWAERFEAHAPSVAEERALDDESERACTSWRKLALARLQTLMAAQRSFAREQGRYAADVSLLDDGSGSGPDLYDFVVTHSDASSFTLEARGKGLMAGDVLEARDGGIRVLRDGCSP